MTTPDIPNVFGNGNGKKRKNNNNNDNDKLGENQRKNSCPWDRVNIVSKYFVFFIWPILFKSRNKILGLEDLYEAPKVDESRRLTKRLSRFYNEELLNRDKPSFLRAMIKTFGPQLALISLLDVASKAIVQPLQILAMGWVIRDSSIYLGTYYDFDKATATTANVFVPTNLTQQISTLTTTTTTTIPMSTLPTTNIEESNLVKNDEILKNLALDSVALIIFTWLINLLGHPYFLQTYHIGLKCRIAACGLIYRKSLRLSQSALVEATTGRMINMLSNDVNRFEQSSQMSINLITAPLQAAVVLLLLANTYLGLYPTLACLGTIIIYVLVQSSLGRGFSKFRLLTARRTDERIRLVNELIVAIRIIKMYAWEEPFKRLVGAARRREINMIAVSSTFKAINQTLFFISSKVIVFSSLITYILLGNPLGPEVVFVSLALSNIVRISLTLFFPNAIAYCAETLVSCGRINQFLMLQEQARNSINYKHSTDVLGCRHAIAFNKVNATWNLKTERNSPILNQLTVAIKPANLTLVVGRVGSGKSSFLMSILGELPILNGCVQVNGRISYAAQEAWIFPGSLRDNILFGKGYEETKYNLIIKVCSLTRDLEILIDSDSTLVGERGVSLSGGQKARVNLARALYQDADIYLLDDPLSAVDAPVARDIFREAIQTYLKGKTVILATHQLQFLKQADKVLVMDRNSQSVFGTLDQICESDLFKELNFASDAFSDAQSARESDFQAAEIAGETGHHAIGRSKTPSLLDFSIRQESPTVQSKISNASTNISVSSRDSEACLKSLLGKQYSCSEMSLSSDQQQQPQPQERERQTRGESVTQIKANLPAYVYYIKSASNWLGLLWFILINIIAQAFFQYNDIFLSLWTDSIQRREVEGAQFKTKTYVDLLVSRELIIIYAILVAGCLFAAFLRSITLFVGTLLASINLHKKFFNSLINAPTKFFDFNPIGILLNRMSRDVGYVDETLPATYSDVIMIATNVAGAILVTIGIEPLNVVASIALLVLALSVRSYCAKMIIRLKQMEGVTGSPVFTHLTVSLNGLTTIRAFKVEERFLRLYERYQNTYTGASFLYLCSARFLSFSIDMLSLIFVTTVIITTLVFSLDSTSASFVGLIISQVIMLPGPIQWGLRQLVELESQMTSVQRIKEYSDLEEEESEEERANCLLTSSQLFKRPPKDKRGEIRFINVSLRYFPDEPPVLNDISLVIKPGERVGIVGRTGAGKSSLISILFRLYQFEGIVEIDGRDTKQMTLGQLRSSISIIPQDPVLFEGSIRKNLDPFDEHSDELIWAALEAVQLGRIFSSTSNKLEFKIQESGSNLSVGQRQLICLARAILRQNKILVLDEATANVDPETDSFIQETIGSKFKDCTIITIAHRLITIVDSDRVLVLDQGKVSEFEEPDKLIKRESSLFSKMLASVQAQQGMRIRRLIEESANRRKIRGQQVREEDEDETEGGFA